MVHCAETVYDKAVAKTGCDFTTVATRARGTVDFPLPCMTIPETLQRPSAL